MITLKKDIMECVVEIILNALYILLSATIVFAQLVVLVPKWLKLFCFYRKAIYAVDKIFQMDKEEEFSYPNTDAKVKLKTGCVVEGEKGFKELLEVIKDRRPFPNIKAKTLCLGFGDIPIPTSGAMPNFALFTKEHGFEKPLYFDPWGSDDPSYIKAILLDWVIRTSQIKIAQYTGILVVIWIAVMTFIIYG